jgi:hypothetical protein
MEELDVRRYFQLTDGNAISMSEEKKTWRRSRVQEETTSIWECFNAKNNNTLLEHGVFIE